MARGLSILNLKARMAWLKTTFFRGILDDFAPTRFDLPQVRVMDMEDVKGEFKIATSFFNYVDNLVVLAIDQTFTGKKQWMWAKFVGLHEALHKSRDFLPMAAGFAKESAYQVMNIFRDCKNEQFAAKMFGKYRKILQMGRKEIWETDTVPYLNKHLYVRQPMQPNDPLWEACNFILCSHTYVLGKDIKVFRKFVKREIKSAQLWDLMRQQGLVLSPETLEIWNEKGAGDLVYEMWRETNNHRLIEMINEFMALFPEPVSQTPPQFMAQPDKHGKSMGEAQAEGESEEDEAEGEDGEGEGKGKGKGKEEDVDDDAEKGKDKGKGKGEESEDESDSDDSSPGKKGDGKGEEDNSNQTDDDFFDDSEGFSEEEEADDVAKELAEVKKTSHPVVQGVGLERDRYNPTNPDDLIAQADPFVGEFAVELQAMTEQKTRSIADSGRFSMTRFMRNPDSSDLFRTRNRISVVPALVYKVTVIMDTSGSMTYNNNQKAKAGQLACMVVHKALRAAGLQYQILCSRSLSLMADSEMSEDVADALLAALLPLTGNDDNFANSLPLILDQEEENDEVVSIVLNITDGCVGGYVRVSERIQTAREKGVHVLGIGMDLSGHEEERLKVVFGDEFCVMAKTTGTPSFAKVMGETITAIVNGLEREHDPQF